MNTTSRKPKEGWQQQNCANFMFIPSRKFALCLYVFIAASNLTLGGVLFTFSNDIKEFRTEYDCNLGTCTVALVVDEKIPAPVYLYYEIEGYYQNHRIYVKSRDPQQLAGGVFSASKLSKCSPVTTVQDLDLKYTSLPPDAPANPCGLIAKSFFQDTFAMQNGSIAITQTGIAWPSDLNGKYRDAEGATKIQWHSVEDEHFIVWMRIAATNDFRKLWGVIKEDIEKGSYMVTVNEVMDYSGFGAKKYVVLSNANMFGGKNIVLSYCLFISGGMATIWTLIFLLYPCFIKK